MFMLNPKNLLRALIINAVFVLIFIGFVINANASEKKFPPYPDKWLFEIDFSKFYKHYSCISVVKMDNGDILMMTEKYKGKLLFEDKEFEIEPEEYEAFCNKYKNRKIEYLFGAKLSDGTPIYKSGSSKQCYDINPYAIKFSKRKKYYWIIKKLYEPKILYDFNRVCDRTARIQKDYLVERFDTPSNHIVTLDDNTFIVFLSLHKEPYGYEGKYIIRFDKNMNTKTDIFRRGEYYLFEIYEFVEWEKKHGVDYGSVPLYNAQTQIDNIMEYIKTLK